MTVTTRDKQIEASLREHVLELTSGEPPFVAIVLGSGLGAFADALEESLSIPFEEVEGMPQSRVPGHAGRFVVGRLGDRRVLVQQGRVHLYEGWSASDVVASVRAFAGLGISNLLLTNAAGGLNRDWAPGTLMRITDHLNLQAATPLEPCEAGWGEPYDAHLGAAIERAATNAEVELESGIYAAFRGPAYETPAEVRMAGKFGAQAVGMSTVLEVLAAYSSKMRVGAISCITNHAAGIQNSPLSHAEVVAAGQAASVRFVRLIVAAVAEL
ncbi:MAG: purine-nucleoside phosphorylase [Planctomycetota bacterium]|jgi:purine-nucleoside phosphorylase